MKKLSNKKNLPKFLSKPKRKKVTLADSKTEKVAVAMKETLLLMTAN